MQKQYINGTWCDAIGGGTWDVINPATETTITTVPFGGAADARMAIQAAVTAFRTWSTLSSWTRAEYLKRAAALIIENLADFARDTTLESGKPLLEAEGEWKVAAQLFEWFAEEGKRAYGRIIPAARPDKRIQVIYQPMGVVGIITAWNFPAYNPARAWAAALAGGCTIVAKGSEYTPLSTMNLMRALVEAGFPPGIANLVNGDAAAIGETLLDEPAVRKISFTGSTRVGKILMDGASRTNTRLALELGGNAPVIIMDDVDAGQMAKAAASVKFRNCGQVCTSPQRFFVHEKIYDQFLEAATAHIAAIPVGNGQKGALGPLINRRQQEQVLDIIAQAEQDGNQLLAGGKKLEQGYFVTPALIACTNAETPFVNREIFGPILPVIRFSTIDEVLEKANATPYGLAAYVFTNRLKDAVHLSEQLEFGMVGINEWYPHGTEAPFIGWKQSGLGHESGSEGLLEYMEKKLISMGGV